MSPALPDPLPHRKVIRSWLSPIADRNTPYALWLVIVDVSAFAAALTAAVLFENVIAQCLAGVLSGLIIGRLFILGHDACHQSLTPHRRLNRWLGRLVFLPSLTPYSLWDVGHNTVHHGYTNLRDFDFVWQPASLEQYRAMSRLRRWRERLYRSGWLPGVYYLVEIWWKRMFFPSRSLMPSRRRIFLADNLLVSAVVVCWLGGLSWAAHATGQSLIELLFVAFVLPLMVWFAMIGFVVYVHHTHPAVAWYSDKAAWMRSSPFVSTTVHLKFAAGVGTLLHHIMEHTAHHVDMSLPLYRLKQAQAVLEQKLPGHIVIQPFSWRWYFDTARRCKLYDFDRRLWTDFAGRPT